MLIARGHGYETGSQGRCTAFDDFDVIAAPLGEFDNAARESRVFLRASGNGTCYGSHVIKLARRKGGRPNGDLYILVHHGGGREVWQIPDFYDGGAMVAALIAMPEREQYALLYTIAKMAKNSHSQGADESAKRYKQAFVDGRLKKQKLRGVNAYKVRIEDSPMVYSS
jgi:hypothetical protein